MSVAELEGVEEQIEEQLEANEVQEVESENETEQEEAIENEADDSEGAEVEDDDAEQAQAEDSEDEFLEITLGEESLTSEAEEEEEIKYNPKLVKELRKVIKEQKKKLKEKEVSPQVVEPQAPQVLRNKPSLSDDGIDYDEDKLSSELDKWYDEKRAVEAQKQALVEQQKEYERQQAEIHAKYVEAKKALKVPDASKFEDYEEAVADTLSIEQQNMILNGAQNPAVLVYALGKSPKRAKELAETKDPLKFIWKAAQLEKDLKTSTKKRTKPSPEKTIKGASKSTGGLQSSYDAALKKGDFTTAAKIKQQLNSK